MKFLVLISENCQNTFMHLKLSERLATLMNYTLDVFTSNRGLKIKIKNMKEYGFDPKFILVSIASVYSSFVEFPEFIDSVVREQRSFKFESFEKVIDLKEKGKIQMQYNNYNYFLKFIELMKKAHEEFKNSIVRK